MKKPRRIGRPPQLKTPFARWIFDSGKSRDWVATRLGVSKSWVTQLACGAYKPSLDLAVSIEKLSKGAVVAASW